MRHRIRLSLLVNEREIPISGIELFRSKIDYHVRIKEYIVSTQEISCVYTEDSCVYTRDLLCMHKRFLPDKGFLLA